jgi:hypothetical protein
VEHPPHKPLHEGIANFVQLCAHPESIDPREYVSNFGRPIDPGGRGSFKPLQQLFGRPVTTRQYPQLASLVAWLLETEPQFLRELARGLADGQTADAVLESHGKTWADLEQRWHAWGARRFAGGPVRGPLFEPQPEFP